MKHKLAFFTPHTLWGWLPSPEVFLLNFGRSFTDIFWGGMTTSSEILSSINFLFFFFIFLFFPERKNKKLCCHSLLYGVVIFLSKFNKNTSGDGCHSPRGWANETFLKTTIPSAEFRHNSPGACVFCAKFYSSNFDFLTSEES